MSINDRETTWADVKPVIHPLNYLRALSVSAWKLAAKMVDDENPDWEDIKRMQATARELELMADDDEECTCTIRDDSCRVCRAVARVIYTD
jgi:hypothetical protein